MNGPTRPKVPREEHRNCFRILQGRKAAFERRQFPALIDRFYARKVDADRLLRAQVQQRLFQITQLFSRNPGIFKMTK
jgi:hypothetical protein